jgi:hypothetical protein
MKWFREEVWGGSSTFGKGFIVLMLAFVSAFITYAPLHFWVELPRAIDNAIGVAIGAAFWGMVLSFSGIFAFLWRTGRNPLTRNGC